jgi:hypothetical protein
MQARNDKKEKEKRKGTRKEAKRPVGKPVCCSVSVAFNFLFQTVLSFFGLCHAPLLFFSLYLIFLLNLI